MTGNKVRFEMTAHGRGKVFIDDVELMNVTAVKFEAALDSVNQVTLTLLPAVVDITTIADVRRKFIAVGEGKDGEQSNA